MNGIKYDFDVSDITIQSNGTFETASVDNQNCALIATSQICRLTKPEIGSQIGVRILNRGLRSVSGIISEAVRAVEADGGTDVSISFLDDSSVEFLATYL